MRFSPRQRDHRLGLSRASQRWRSGRGSVRTSGHWRRSVVSRCQTVSDRSRDRDRWPGREQYMVARIMRRRIASAAVAATAGLVTGAAATPTAQAAHQAPANARAPRLHATATIALGSTTSIFKNIFAEAPDRTVFFSKGSVVYVQKAGSAPQVALHA